MGYRPNGNGYTDGRWIATLGGMVAEGTQVRAECRVCKVALEVDLIPLLMRRGAQATLLNWHPKCRVVGCEGRVVFSAKPGGDHGTPFRPCIKT